MTFTSTSTTNTIAIADTGGANPLTITSKTAFVAAVKAQGVGGVDVGAVTITDPNQATSKASTISSVALNADSCDAAQAYRFDAARDSWMMPPTVTR